MESVDLTSLEQGKDGQHVIASRTTPAGKLEARITVKDKVASRPGLFLNGQPLKPISEAEIPEAIRACIKRRSEAPSGFTSCGASVARARLDFVVSTAEAATCTRWHFAENCGKVGTTNFCVVQA